MKYIKFLKMLAILALPSMFLINVNATGLPSITVAQGDTPILTCTKDEDFCIYLQRDASIPDSQTLNSKCQLNYEYFHLPIKIPFTNSWTSHNLQIVGILSRETLAPLSDLSFSISSINGKKTSSCSLSVNGSLAPALKIMQVSYDPNSSTYNCTVIR